MRDKLTAAFAAKKTKPGRYGDGGSLYLLIKKDGLKYWIFRWRDRISGKLRERGLGRYGRNDVSLQEARQRAKHCRDLVWEGKDPIEEAKKELEEKKLAYAKRKTFRQCMDMYIAAHQGGWKNEKHAKQFPSSLNSYAARLMDLPVADINTPLVLSCLEPSWQERTITTKRVQTRIENILDWATARKYRKGENPARWKGYLENLLAKPTNLTKVKHLAALDYVEAGQFMQKLRAQDSLAARAFEFQILTATRPGEALGARWDEIDLAAKLWRIDSGRMKGGKTHEIPLSPQAIKLLKALPQDCAFVFPSMNKKKGLGVVGSMRIIRKLGGDFTAHGFRSSFRDWAADQTAFPREVIEHALSHQLKDKAEAAYARSTVFPKRVKLMTAWANYCDQLPGDSATVTPIRKGALS